MNAGETESPPGATRALAASRHPRLLLAAALVVAAAGVVAAVAVSRGTSSTLVATDGTSDGEDGKELLGRTFVADSYVDDGTEFPTSGRVGITVSFYEASTDPSDPSGAASVAYNAWCASGTHRRADLRDHRIAVGEQLPTSAIGCEMINQTAEDTSRAQRQQVFIDHFFSHTDLRWELHGDTLTIEGSGDRLTLVEEPPQATTP